jgi:TolB-like protein
MPDASATRIRKLRLEEKMFQRNKYHVNRAVRRIAAAACVFAGLGGMLAAQTPVPLETAVGQIAEDIEERLDPKTKIAILSFNTTSERLSAHVIDELSALLVNSGKLDVLDRKYLDLIAEEAAFQASGEVSESSMQSFGQKLGAAAVIAGSMEDLGEYYLVRFRTLEVETARVLRVSRVNVRKDDPQIARLMQGRQFLDTKRFVFGLAGGMELGLYTLDDTYKKETYHEPAMESLTSFHGTVYGALNVTTLFAVQFELNVMQNSLLIDGVDKNIYQNGYEDEYGTFLPSWEESKLKDLYTYMSLDIPLLARFNFRPARAVLVSIVAGPYVSLPISDLTNDCHYPNFAQSNETRDDTISNVQFGVLAGIAAGFAVGPGYISARARFINDFVPLIANYWGEEDKVLFTRRVMAFSLGYEIWI